MERGGLKTIERGRKRENEREGWKKSGTKHPLLTDNYRTRALWEIMVPWQYSPTWELLKAKSRSRIERLSV